MTNEDFKEMYLLLRQQRLFINDMQIIYGKDKTDEFQKELKKRKDGLMPKYEVTVKDSKRGNGNK